MPETFQLATDFIPRGDQPQAIQRLVAGVQAGEAHQVLLGVTGSGKTFTIANVIARVNLPRSTWWASPAWTPATSR